MSFARAARLLGGLLLIDSRLKKLYGETRLSQTDSLLVDVLDRLNAIKYFTAVDASKGLGAHWPKIVAGAPKLIEKPLNDHVPAKPKVALTKGKDLKSALGKMMNRAMTRAVIGKMGR